MSDEKEKRMPYIPLNDFFDPHGFEDGKLSSGCNERWALFLRHAAIRCLRENMIKLGIGVAEHVVGKTKNRVRLWFHASQDGHLVNFLPEEAAQELPGNNLPNKFHEAFRASSQTWQANWSDLMLDWKKKEQAKQKALLELQKKKKT